MASAPKKFGAYGLTLKFISKDSSDVQLRGITYTDAGNWVPTRIIWDDNPFNDDVKNAKVILDFGCGVGRNLPFIMENTDAHYVGIEPYQPMFDGFWKSADEKYRDRVTLCQDFDCLPSDMVFDVVVSTFVMMHLGYRAPADMMNVADMTRAIQNHTHKETVWIMFEHDREERGWIDRWMKECDIDPDVYERNYKGWPEMLSRGDHHHLIIWRG